MQNMKMAPADLLWKSSSHRIQDADECYSQATEEVEVAYSSTLAQVN